MLFVDAQLWIDNFKQSRMFCQGVKSCFYWFVFLGLFFVPFFCVDVGLEKICLTLEVMSLDTIKKRSLLWGSNATISVFMHLDRLNAAVFFYVEYVVRCGGFLSLIVCLCFELVFCVGNQRRFQVSFCDEPRKFTIF